MFRSILGVLLLAFFFIPPGLALAQSNSLDALNPPDYQGLRLDRTFIPVDTPKTIGNPKAWANIPIPNNVTLDSAGPQVVKELRGFITPFGSWGTYVNRTAYTPDIYTVPADQQLHPVRYCFNANAVAKSPSTVACSVPSWAINFQRVLAGTSTTGVDLHGGVPIPDGVTRGAPGTDGEIVIYQPDYVNPKAPTHIGRAWEMWEFQPNPAFDPTQPESPTNARFMAATAGRYSPMNTYPLHSQDRWWQSGVVDGNQPGAPDSEYQAKAMKVEGSGLALINDVVSSEDCAIGHIDHAIGLMVPRTRYGIRWPASTSDGYDSSLTITEGMRLRITPGTPKPLGLTGLGSMVWDAAAKYGFVIDDQTNHAVGIRIQLGSLQCLTQYGGLGSNRQIDWLATVPLQLLAVGTDANPNPIG